MTRSSLFAGLLAAPLLSGRAALADPAVADNALDLAPLALATGWLGERLTAARLHGRAVLVDVFTFECINCVRVTPNLLALYGAYARTDLEIVGVHTPEVPSYQSRLAYLARETKAARIPWPIAIDNRSAIWNAYGVSAWPTQLFFDRAGRLQQTIVGDGRDADVRAAVRAIVGRRA